jgi:hypothetical protein
VSGSLRAAIEAEPEVAALLAGEPFQAAITRELVTAYVDYVGAAQDALIGDLGNWKPVGILAASERARAVEGDGFDG